MIKVRQQIQQRLTTGHGVVNMGKALLESILNNNLVEAQELFNNRMEIIAEQKLFETKRRIASLNEVVKPVKGQPGKYAGVNEPKDWAKYRKAHPAVGMYDTPTSKGKPPEHERTASGGITKHGIETRRKKGFLKAHPALKALEFITKVKKYKETGKLDEELPPIVKTAQERAAAAAKAGKSAEQPTPRDASSMGSAKSSTHDLKYITPQKRREMLTARRAAKVAELEKTSPEKATELKTRITKAQGRDTLNTIAKDVGKVITGKSKKPTIGDVAKHVTSSLAAAKG